MFKPLVAAVTALSLTLASTAPAHAGGLDREDVGKILLGLAAIAVINGAIENNRRQDETPQVTQNSGNRSWADLNRPRPRQDDNRMILPERCLQTLDTRFGRIRLFGERCLDRHYRYAASLPEHCEVRLFTDQGPQSGYDPLCLRDHGYRTNRRH